MEDLDGENIALYTTTKKIKRDLSKAPRRRLGWRPASVNHGLAAGPATALVNTLTEAGHIRKLPRLIIY
jgi:hypothetical protein